MQKVVSRVGAADLAARRSLRTRPTHRTPPALPANAASAESAAPAPVEAELIERDGKLPSKLKRKSLAARYGTSHVPEISLPVELQTAVMDQLLGTDRKAIRREVEALWARIHEDWEAPTEFAKSEQQGETLVELSKMERYKRRLREEKQAIKDPIRYDDLGSLAYTVGVLPQAYAATKAVLLEVSRRLAHAIGDQSAFKPRKVVDWGSGVGAAAWASREVWPELDAYVGIDRSPPTRQLAQTLFAGQTGASTTTWSHQGFFDTSQPSHAGDTANAAEASSTLAIAAFTLSDLLAPVQRRKLVGRMWDSGAEVIVLIDRGSPAGFARIAAARDQLLKMGRSSLTREADPDAAWEMIDTVTGEVSPPMERQKAGSYVVAPCPHDEVCPLLRQRDFCHFIQQYKRPEAERNASVNKRGEGKARYSYVVVRRGNRPLASTFEPAALTTLLPSTTEDMQSSLGSSKTSRSAGDFAQAAAVRQESVVWPRLLYPPLKGNSSVTLDACTASGKILRWSVGKTRDGEQVWRDAAEAHWGDLFPHEATSKLEERTRGIRNLTRLGGPRKAKPTDDALHASEDNDHDAGDVSPELAAWFRTSASPPPPNQTTTS